MTDKEIRETIGDPALFEGLAEEAVELAKEALKLARILRGENPTSADEKATRRALIEECTDLMFYLNVLDVSLDYKVYRIKKRRMEDRIREADV